MGVYSLSDLWDIFIYISKGFALTFKLFSVTAILAIPLGILFALGKGSRSRLIRYALEIYTWIFRGTPLVLQLLFTYYGIPIITASIPFIPRINLTMFGAATITFAMNYAAYLTEVFRGGIESIDKGQHEASRAIGMTYFQKMAHIILPQTIKRVLPPTCNEAINLIKDTALISVIGMSEISRNAKELVVRDFTITPFIVAAIIYLVITSFIVMFFRKMEKRLSYYE